MRGEKKRRRAYLDDFQLNAAGEYVYRGKTYSFEEERHARPRAMTLLCLAAGAAFACTLAAGCVPAAGMDRCGYVLLPYAGAVLFSALLCWDAGRIAAGKDPLRAYVHEVAAKTMPAHALAAALFAAGAMAGDAVYLALNGAEGKAAGTAGFFALLLAAGAAALAGRRLLRSLRWRENDK
ncbi:MAG: hypothetical protein VB021_09895 [Oscillospiraceae bacterium]|nr:hypothetical protein [Oscillospiraceae bacterium]